MKQSMMIIFFTVFVLLYVAVNWYVFSRGYKALDGTGFQRVFPWIYWGLAVSFIVGQMLERGDPATFSRLISLMGSLWLATFLYALLFVIAVDLFRLLHYFFNFIPEAITTGFLSGKSLFVYGAVFALGMTVYGYINANNPKINVVNITLDKKNSKADHLRVVLATDVHLGVLLRNKKADQLLKDINAQNADLVLFGGDLVDHNPVPVVKNNMGQYFEQIKATLGVFAVTGNHEYIGHPEISVDYFTKHGVVYLRDTVHTIEDLIHLAGRDDREGRNFNGGRRKSTDELFKNTNGDLPILLLDHQPVEYDNAVRHNVGLMMSGHTHKGQLWPLNYITSLMFENDYGLYKKGNTQFYTSTGYGTWGPPVRTGNRPELVVFNITFK